MEKQIEIGEKKFTVKELKYKDIAVLTDLSKAEVAKSMVVSATGMSEEDYNDLSMKEGIELMKSINEVNGLETEDFQTATQIKD